MRRSTIQSGLRLVIAAELSVIIAAFYHEHVAELFLLSSAVETHFIFLALFWGGILGFWGIVLTVIGLLRSPFGGKAVSLLRPLLILAVFGMFFLYLLLSSFTAPARPQLRPGETITL